MAFSGGGSNVLKPHTHDSGILQDGGSLRFDGITESSMASGSVTFSDGNNLQELAIGSPSAQLIVNAGATAPEWSTEHTQGSMQLIETFKSPGTAATYTFTFDALGPDDISALVLIYSMSATAALNLQMVVEGINGAGENETNINRLDASSNTAFAAADLTSVQLCSSTMLSAVDQTANGYAYIQNTDTGTKRPCSTGSVSGQNTAALETFGACSFVAKDSFTTIEVKTSTSTWKANSIFSLYKILR